MKVIWTDGAVEDLEEIIAYIQKGSPDAAFRVGQNIYDCVMGLRSMPRRGHRRDSDGAWLMLVDPWPYVIVYDIHEEAVTIDAIRHAARDSRQ